MRHEDPIAALASGGGPSAIAVIRLTGKGTLERLAGSLRPRVGGGFLPGAMRLCTLEDQATGEVIDEPMAVFFAGPRSYTGQDSVEVYLHGGPYIIQRALRYFYSLGFREADPGEFTQRAFLNGKLDLTTAEGIKELVEASSHQQWVAARHLATGHLRSTIEDLRKAVVEAMAYLEAQIDFPDEKETASLALASVTTRVAAVKAKLSRLSRSFQSGQVAVRGLRVALVGSPNAGKSTLLNTLLGRNRAIVSAHPGTTRDYLEESALVLGRLIRLVDTAGIRHTTDDVEMIGVKRSREIAEEADIVIFLTAADSTEDDLQHMQIWRAEIAASNGFQVVTKCDLPIPASLNTQDQIKVSSKTGAGLEELRERLAAAVDAHIKPLSEEPFITSTRHRAAVDSALEAINRFEAAVAAGAYEEMLAFELQEAAGALRSIIGDVGQDDIFDKIFSEFCIGK